MLVDTLPTSRARGSGSVPSVAVVKIEAPVQCISSFEGDIRGCQEAEGKLQGSIHLPPFLQSRRPLCAKPETYACRPSSRISSRPL